MARTLAGSRPAGVLAVCTPLHPAAARPGVAVSKRKTFILKTLHGKTVKKVKVVET